MELSPDEKSWLVKELERCGKTSLLDEGEKTPITDLEGATEHALQILFALTKSSNVCLVDRDLLKDFLRTLRGETPIVVGNTLNSPDFLDKVVDESPGAIRRRLKRLRSLEGPKTPPNSQ